MGGEYAVIVLILLISGIILLAIAISKRTIKDRSTSVHIDDDLKSGPGGVSVDPPKSKPEEGGGYVPKVVEDTHSITPIYTYKENSSIWICPNCETENSTSTTSCCVCEYRK